MRVYGSVTGSSGEVLIVSIRDVDSRSRVAVLLGQSEVDDEQFVTMSTNSHQEAKNVVSKPVIGNNLKSTCQA